MSFSILYDAFKSIGIKHNLKISGKIDFIYYLLKKPEISSRMAERYYKNPANMNKEKVLYHFINNAVIDFNAFINSIFSSQNVPSELMESCKSELRRIYTEITSQPAKNISEGILLERCVHHISEGDIYNSYFVCPLKKVPVFYGRSEEIKNIHKSLEDNNIIFIKGIAGIGKTQCILEYTNRFHTEYRNIAFGQSSNSVQDALYSILFNKPHYEYFRENKNNGGILDLLRFLPYNNLIVLECDSITSKDQEIINTLAEMEVKIVIATRDISISDIYPVITISELNSTSLKEMLDKIYSEGESQIKKPSNHIHKPLTDEDKEKIINICYHHTLLVSLTAHLLHLKPELKRDLLNITSIKDFKGSGRISHIYDNEQKAITSHILDMLKLARIPDCDLNYLALLSLFTPVPIQSTVLEKWGFNRDLNTLKSYGFIEFSQSSDNNTYLSMHPLISDALWSAAQLAAKSINDRINCFISHLNWANEKITNYTTLYAIINTIVKRITPMIKSFHNPEQKKVSKALEHWWHSLTKLLIFKLESGSTSEVNAIFDRLFKVDEYQRTTKHTRPDTRYSLSINERQKLFLEISQFYTQWLNEQLSTNEILENLATQLTNSPVDSNYDLHWHYYTIWLDRLIHSTYTLYINLIVSSETVSPLLYLMIDIIHQLYLCLITRIDLIFSKMNKEEQNNYAIEYAYYCSNIPLMEGDLINARDYLIYIGDNVYFGKKTLDILNKEYLINYLPNTAINNAVNNAVLRLKININHMLSYLLADFTLMIRENGNYYPDFYTINQYRANLAYLQHEHQGKIWPIQINDYFTIVHYLFFALTKDFDSAIEYTETVLLNTEQLDLPTQEKETRLNHYRKLRDYLLKCKELYM